MIQVIENRVKTTVENNIVRLDVVRTIVKLVEIGRVILIKEGSAPIEETLIGTVDGINKTFTTSKDFIPGSTWVYINGVKQRRGVDYTESGTNTIVFDEAPSNVGFNDELTIIYRTSE